MVSHLQCILSWGLLFLSVEARVVRRSDVRSLFTNSAWSPNTTITFPGSDGFVDATERWSVFKEPTYAAAVSPATEKDVAQAVKIATSNCIPFLATGARHGYTTTFSNLKNGVAIDLSQFNSIKVDKSTGIMTIGGGVRLDEIYDPVFEAGYEFQIGTASCPGVVGLTLGAGVGPWAGVHGLLLDALLSMRVVTANGSAITVSQSSHPDLFWAMRGAGANFGVVVSATYQLQPQTNNGQILVADILVPAAKAPAYFNLLQSYDGGRLPQHLSISSFMSWNATINDLQITASWAYLGPEDEGLKEFQPLFDLDPIIGALKVYPYNKVIQTVAFGADAYICQDGGIHDIYTVNARNISAQTYQAVFRDVSTFFAQNPAFQASSIQVAIFPNNAALAVPSASTAYPWRDTIVYVDIELGWGGDSSLEKLAAQVGVKWRKQFAATSGYPQLAAYVNSAHGDEKLESIYGADKLPRLLALKKIWDPSNVFRFNNPIHS
ncbi:FAD-binding domain-containing protein [Nemania sp. NC0429]|nr:FAD-binding domain-containing protein [Nemania sp. NC0429]